MYAAHILSRLREICEDFADRSQLKPDVAEKWLGRKPRTRKV